MPLKENDVRFFRPLWIRLTVTAVLAAALVYELIWTHDQLWIGIWACGIAYCVYNFFWKWPKDLPPLEKPATASATPAEAVAPPADAPASEPPKQP